MHPAEHLPAAFRTALVLTASEGSTQQELAQREGLSLSELHRVSSAPASA